MSGQQSPNIYNIMFNFIEATKNYIKLFDSFNFVSLLFTIINIVIRSLL